MVARSAAKGKAKAQAQPKTPARAQPVAPTVTRRKAGARGRARAPAASPAVVAEWGRRVEAEYRSAAVTQHLTLWLVQMGASPDLIRAGLRIVEDELAHAALSHETFRAAGGASLAPIARESLALEADPTEPLEQAVLCWGVEIFCLGETVAVPLFKVLREGCRVPAARRTLDRVLRDEVRHRDFGWRLLGFLLELDCADELRALLAHELPGMVTRLRQSYAPAGGEAETTLPEADRAWGLMPMAKYGEVLLRTVERDFRPRFADLGIDAAPAWHRAAAAHMAGGATTRGA
ncbi:MAG: ferritin-like domain-containing protein [Myxococcales bacterium]|nr:ferritin-like domain-containing protein [Myxococcales bacterium]